MFQNNVVCEGEVAPVYGIPVVSSPVSGGSIMVGFDFGVPCGPVTNTPPAKETGASTAAAGHAEAAGSPS